MRAADLIMKKRDGQVLSYGELRFFIEGYVAGEIPDYQAASWLMAVYFKGMSAEETGNLTKLMMHSGKVLDLSSLKGPLVDKHSTGGVGDKTSLILAPVAAACGVQVPMMSGRALGHTGGTLDKLESLKGYNVTFTEPEILRILRETGYIVMGQTEHIVPADRKMYALRDVTATVESIPLITASILSKKLAEGADSLVFDVKCGSGAFMKNEEAALELADSLVNTGKAMGRKIIALITAMDEPLGNMVGNFLEVEEAWECLQGRGPEDLMEVSMALAARMLMAAGVCTNPEKALFLCREKIDNGEASRIFLENLKSQGGDPDWFRENAGSWRAPVRRVLKASAAGYISRIDAFQTGMAGISLGVGRSRAGDPVEPHTGIRFFAKTGDFVEKNEAVCEIFALSNQQADEALGIMERAVKTDPEKPEVIPRILREIT